jgi:thiamine biosynthesis lipoprotein
MLKLRLLPFCAGLLAAVFLTGCVKADPSRAEFVLGTVCSITLYDQAKPKIYRDIFNRLREIENHMSVNIGGTDVDRINAAAGTASVQVHEDVFELIERALYFAEISEGAFDPTVGPLVSLWGIGGENARLPSQAEIDTVLPLIDWRDIKLDKEQLSVFLKRHGMMLDLGAIAKGYAADEAAAIIKKAGLRQAIIDLGGNIFVVGEKRDKSLWKVGLQNPLEIRGAYIGIIQGREQTVVTSGIYERYFELDGIRYHHIFSASNGYPVRNGLLSVTIIAGNSMDADALSTAVFALGYEKGRALIESLPGIEAIFVFDDLGVRKTLGVDFILTDDDYYLMPG